MKPYHRLAVIWAVAAWLLLVAVSVAAVVVAALARAYVTSNPGEALTHGVEP